jgi:hypothetical protein
VFLMAWKSLTGFDANNQNIINVADPTADTHAANKQYVDAVARGLKWKQSVVAATTANITIATALNSGDTIDGVSLTDGDRVLVKNQSTASENGIYVVGASPARAADLAASSDGRGVAVTVTGGSVNGDKVYIQTADTAVVGTNDLSFSQLGGGGTVYSADGNGIEESGGVFSLELATNSALSKSSSGLTVASSIAGDALTMTSGVLNVAAGTGLEISSDTIRIAAAAAGNGLSGGGGSALAVNTGTAANTGLEVSSDAVRIATAAAGDGLTGGGGSALAVGAGNGITVNSNDVALASSVAGSGLAYSSGVLNIGAGTGITANADSIEVDTSVVVTTPSTVVRKYSANVPNGSTTAVITHNLGTKDITWSLRQNSDDAFVVTDGVATDTNTLTLTFATAPTSGQYRVVVHG